MVSGRRGGRAAVALGAVVLVRAATLPPGGYPWALPMVLGATLLVVSGWRTARG